MNIPARRQSRVDHDSQLLGTAQGVLREEADALLALADHLDDSFVAAVEMIRQATGSVIVTGMGKAGLIGQKIAATLASTGTRSHLIHPAEAIHGDLGRIDDQDIVMVLSHSGETEEVVRLLPALVARRLPILAMTGRAESQLGQQADVVLSIGSIEEAGELKLAPTTSTTMMLALGDALSLVLSQLGGFQAEDFARYHPGGSLGRQLALVEEMMRPLADCRLAEDSKTVREVLVKLGRPGRRCGAVLVVNANGMLTGIFTDSDLARILEQQQEHVLDGPIREVMTESPRMITHGKLMSEAIDVLVACKISELPVVDDAGCPVGLIDITDVVEIATVAEFSEHGEEAGEKNSEHILPLTKHGRSRD